MVFFFLGVNKNGILSNFRASFLTFSCFDSQSDRKAEKMECKPFVPSLLEETKIFSKDSNEVSNGMRSFPATQGSSRTDSCLQIVCNIIAQNSESSLKNALKKKNSKQQIFFVVIKIKLNNPRKQLSISIKILRNMNKKSLASPLEVKENSQCGPKLGGHCAK